MRAARRAWPWLVLAAVAAVAVWHFVDFSDFDDTEFPKVVRPHFSPRPPAVYRLSEPGDTLDRVGLYLSAGSVALALAAIGSRRRTGLASWPSALALGLAATWHASTPGPGVDGWHGLGWRAIFNPAAPVGLRLALASAAVGLAGVVVVNLARQWAGRREWSARGSDLPGLLLVSAFLVALRQVEIPGLEPAGYWPRCSFDLGMLAFGLALIRARPIVEAGWRWAPALRLAACWGLLVAGGIAVTIHHRPLARLKVVVPGRIYLSAMPSYRGLAIEQGRIGFRTIVNLFDESSSQASPYHDDEIRYVREHGLRYLGSPSDGLESDRFLKETLALAEDPEAWPILVHCHGCMDRSPAWMGLYRFLVEKKPLAEVFAEIERHRGTRPKAVVILQYNRKLPRLDPERFAADPTGQLLVRSARGTADPFERPGWNTTASPRRVVTRIEPETRRP